MSSWGEFGPSLKDMITLTSLPLFRVCPRTRGDPRRRGLEEARLLEKALSDSRYGANKATYLVEFFEEGEGRNNRYQVEALLTY